MAAIICIDSGPVLEFTKLGKQLEELDASGSEPEVATPDAQIAHPPLGVNSRLGHQLQGKLIHDRGHVSDPLHFACFTGRPSSLQVAQEEPSFVRRTIGDVKDAQLDLIKALSNRGFTLGSLLELVCILVDKTSAFSEIQDLEAAYMSHSGLLDDQWPDLTFFDPATTQTWEVVYRVLVPLSQRHSCAFSEILSGHQACLAQRMVSHTWGNIFADTVAACVAAVQCKGYFFHVRPRMCSVSRILDLMRELGSEALSVTFWLCAASVNQHSVACHDSPWPCPCSMPKVIDGPFSEIGSFDMMMQYLNECQADFLHVIAADDESRVRVEISFNRKFLVTRQLYYNSSIKSLGTALPLISSLQTYNLCGLQINWQTRCVNQVFDSDATFSRNIFAGDVIESVNGCEDVGAMGTILSCDDKKIELVLRRRLSVTTRIWVVAEIAEAQKRRLPQLVVSHFPLSLSGPEYKLRIKAADVMASEASKASDRDMILARISHNANEYNQRLKKVLSVTPWSWQMLGLPTVEFALLGYELYEIIYIVRIGGPASELVANMFWGLGIIVLAGMGSFGVRFHWIVRQQKFAKVPQSVSQDIHNQIIRYLQPHSHVIWARPFLAIGFLVSGSARQRILAMTAVWFVTAVCLVMYDVIQALDCDKWANPDVFCRSDAYLMVVWEIFAMATLYPLLLAITEQSLLFARRDKRFLIMLCLPFLFSLMVQELLMSQSIMLAGMYFLLWFISVVFGLERNQCRFGRKATRPYTV